MEQTIRNTIIRGIATCVPSQVVTNDDLEARFGEKTMRRFGKSTGILERRIAREETSLDLSIRAAEALLKGRDRETISVLIFVSQTSDYLLPASAAIAQHRLGLGIGTAAFDINLGCSGYVYGLLVAAKMLAGTKGSALVLAGDTISKLCDPADRATTPIFGDAGSATLIEARENVSEWLFQVATDGSGAKAIIAPHSSFPVVRSAAGYANDDLSELALKMDGPSVFNFATTRAPEMLKAGLEEIGWRSDDIDTFALHQANTLILDTIARKLGVAKANTLNSLANFGNTSCASIPLALTQSGGGKFGKTAMCGFGVGLSWASLFADLGTVDIDHLDYRDE